MLTRISHKEAEASKEIETRIQAAEALYLKLSKLGYKYGCFEVSLVALGAKLSIEDVDRKTKLPSQVVRSERLRKAGLEINWLIGSDQQVTAAEITAVLNGRIQFDESYLGGTIVGYLLSEHYPQKRRGHTVAIIVNDTPDSNTVMDTEMLGKMLATAENLASKINYVLSKGGSFEIAQIKKK
jgi:hypothetical protein